MKVVELRLASMECAALGAAHEAASKRLSGIKDEEVALINEIASAESAIDVTRNEYSGVESAYKDVRERLSVLERELSSAERGRELAKARAEEIKRNEARLREDINELRGRADADAAERDRLGAEAAEADAFIDAEGLRLSENSSRLDAISAEYKAMEAERNGHAACALKTNARISEVRHALQNCLKDEDATAAREAKAAGVLDDAGRALSAMEEDRRAVGEALAKHGGRRDALDARMRELREALSALEAGLQEKNREIKEVRAGHAKAAARLSTLEEMERNFENIKGGAKSVMRASGLQGMRGLLADCIEANPGFERAVEAVLGDRLQYVLVEGHKEGVDAVEYLKGNGGGRGSFVPLRDARPLPGMAAVRSGVSGYEGARPLLGEVRVKEGCEVIVHGLLSDAVIVDSLDAALAAWRENGAVRTFVTPGGETVDCQGIITGGAEGGADGGILQRRAEIKKTAALAAALAEKTATLDAAIKETAGAIEAASAALEACREKLHSADIERIGADARLARLNEEMGRLARARTDAQRELSEARSHLEGISAKKLALSGERGGLETNIAAIDERIAGLTAALLRLSEKKEEATRAATEIKISIARARERVEALRKEASAKARQIEETGSRLSAKGREIEAGVAEAARIEGEMSEMKARLDALLGEADAVRKAETALTERLGDLAAAIKGAEAGLKERKANEAAMQGIKAEVSIALKEAEIAFENLCEKTVEKYGVSIDSYRPADDDGIDVENIEPRRAELREKITGLGEVSLGALEEYNELERRHQFLLDQRADLQRSVDALTSAITRINRTTRERFATAFEEINARFKETFPKFFNGGRAELRLAEDADVLEAGVEIVAQPPGKRLQNITLLSGGEKALTATSLIFAIFLMKPSPFCLLDEVDAPLDEANIDRFNAFVKELSRESQFILITHNKKTMETADALYGVTMEEPGISKTITVRF
ncbi:MAG: chromosome segregation protein SMC [Deltaproteobacteria bacterium]|nr:chromosome segregation protein SMC [Deltaproteobacteria bacterium]